MRIFRKAREISSGGQGIPELDDRPRYPDSGEFIPRMSIVTSVVVMERSPMVCSFGTVDEGAWYDERPRQAPRRGRPVEVRDWTHRERMQFYQDQYLPNAKIPYESEAQRLTRMARESRRRLLPEPEVKEKPPLIDVFQVERKKRDDDDFGPSSLA